jgi:hypothetical protein
MNVYKIVRICCELDAWLVLRAVGIVVPPLGAVVGFL